MGAEQYEVARLEGLDRIAHEPATSARGDERELELGMEVPAVGKGGQVERVPGERAARGRHDLLERGQHGKRASGVASKKYQFWFTAAQTAAAAAAMLLRE